MADTSAQYRALTTQPITTQLNGTTYEWAGRTLQQLLGTQERYAELWPFFSGPGRPAAIANTASTGVGPLTMQELITKAPEVLGPDGQDPENGGQKYFFVKFLDPSDFPPFAYVGFAPEAVAHLSLDASAFRSYFADLLWQDRQAVEQVAERLRPLVTTPERFDALKTAYKTWSIEQAKTNWQRPLPFQAPEWMPARLRGGLDELLRSQQQVRRSIVALMHRIDYEDDQALLIETPTLHAIAGLSLQIHPRTPGNFHPKDELWIYKPIDLPRGGRGWVLVEPQRTFDVTESGADFFTPFAWREGRLGFRKTISRAYLDSFTALMDAAPKPRAHYLRRAQPMEGPESVTLRLAPRPPAVGSLRIPPHGICPWGSTRGSARWYRLVDEPAWPYFLARELRVEGEGESTLPLTHHSFIELHVTRGAVELVLSGGRAEPSRITVSPTQPVLLPASLPHTTLTFRATKPATLHFFTRHPR